MKKLFAIIINVLVIVCFATGCNKYTPINTSNEVTLSGNVLEQESHIAQESDITSGEHQHTTNMGICSVCGELQGETEMLQLVDHILATGKKKEKIQDSMEDEWNSMCSSWGVEEAEDFFKRSADRMQTVLDELSEEADQCKDSELLKNVGIILNKIASEYPVPDTMTEKQDVINYMNKLDDWSFLFGDLGTALKDVSYELDKIKQN